MAANCMSSHGDTCHLCEPPHGPGLAPIVSGLVWLLWSAGLAGDPKAVRWTQVGVWMQRNPRIKNGATQKAASEVFCEDRRIMGEAQMPGRLWALMLCPDSPWRGASVLDVSSRGQCRHA